MGQVTINTLTSGQQDVSHTDFNNLVVPIANEFNGSIDNTNIAENAAIAYSKLSLGGSIVNADISSSAAIAFTKLATLTSAYLLVGNASNQAAAVAMSGDVAITNAGVTTVGDLTIASETTGDILQYDGSGWERAVLLKGSTGTTISTYTATGSSTYDDVDASAVVGTKKALIYFQVTNNDGSTPCNIMWRPNGASVTLELASTNIHPSTAALPAGKTTFGMVVTDASGIFEIASSQAVSLTVKSWFYIVSQT